jgi:hypothetical protein
MNTPEGFRVAVILSSMVPLALIRIKSPVYSFLGARVIVVGEIKVVVPPVL